MALGELKNGIGPDAYAIYQQVLAAVVERDRPVGSLYISENSTSPAELFGGTWERIEGKFIMGAGDTYPAGSTGGEAKVAITVEQMPRHKHDWIGVMNKRKGEIDHSNYAPDISEDYLVSSYNSKAGVQYAGEGKPHNNIPPYYSMYIWRRVA